MLLFCSLQGNACVEQSVTPSVYYFTILHTILHEDNYLMELAILLLKLRERFHRSMLHDAS